MDLSVPGHRPVRQVIDVLVSEKRDLAATRRFFTRALDHAPSPIEVTTDRAAAYPRVLDELVPAACHATEQYGNNSIEADHGRLKSRLRPMRGLKQLRCARVIIAGHAFIQNIRCGHYELGALGGRGNSKPTGPGCLRRAGHGDLTNLDYRSCLPRLCTTQQPSPRPVPRKWRSLGCWPKVTTSSPSSWRNPTLSRLANCCAGPVSSGADQRLQRSSARNPRE